MSKLPPEVSTHTHLSYDTQSDTTPKLSQNSHKLFQPKAPQPPVSPSFSMLPHPPQSPISLPPKKQTRFKRYTYA